MKTGREVKFEKEVDLCSAFLSCIPEGWTPYAETGGFDILLVRKSDGFQIGVEAKLKLNAKVIAQVAETSCSYGLVGPAPDCRAVLVPEYVNGDLTTVCALLGITPIRMRSQKAYRFGSREISPSNSFSPWLPDESQTYGNRHWFERCPDSRIKLPDYIPDVVAGDKSPLTLTEWKIKAIKIVVTLEKYGFVTRRDFKHFGIDMKRWTDPYSGWLVKDGQGGWIAGDYLPDFRAQHPRNFVEIEADFEEWKSPPEARQPGMFAGAEKEGA